MKTHNILIIVDAQNDFITGSLANPIADERVPLITDTIRDYPWDLIITTYDTHQPNYLNTKEGEKLPIPHCIYKEIGWQLDTRIVDALDYVRSEDDTRIVELCKPTFGSEELIDYIYDFCEPEPPDEFNIVMCGFCTDICVISNALILKANFYDTADIKVIANACAGVTPESHEAALTVMRSCQINVV